MEASMSNFTITHSGNIVNLTNPEPRSISLHDIAHSLTNTKRFTGFSSYTIAEHSIVCALAVNVSGLNESGASFVRLCSLMHDFHEAYTGDIATPVAREIGQSGMSPLRSLKRRMQKAIHQSLGVPACPVSCQSRIARIDREALVSEAWSCFPKNAAQEVEQSSGLRMSSFDTAPIAAAWQELFSRRIDTSFRETPELVWFFWRLKEQWQKALKRSREALA